MPCDKDFGYVTLTWGVTCERYGDLWQLTYVTMSETTPKDHLIILREFLAGNKTLAMSSSIRARVNYSRVRVNCSCTSIKLHLNCTIHNIQHRMLDFNNSCTTLTECNIAQKIQYSKSNSQYIHSQHNTTVKEHNTTQNICRAECTSSSANTIYNLHGTMYWQ